jgi:hypothetical protein
MNGRSEADGELLDPDADNISDKNQEERSKAERSKTERLQGSLSFNLAALTC